MEGNTEVWSSLGHVYAVAGKREEAQKVIDHLKELSVHQYVAPYNFAVIYAGLGNKDEAFVWLNRAYQERSYLLTDISRWMSVWTISIPTRALTNSGVGSDSLR